MSHETAPPAHPARVLLFTGHMIDAPGRETPRFPATPAAEADARRMIRTSVERERATDPGEIVGIAGGACGGDILFHEVCEDLGIQSRLFLALPQADFCASSVQHGGEQWVKRYTRLCDRVPVRVLDRDDPPARLAVGADGLTVWQRSNLWMLASALALQPGALTLIALWDNGPADGPGGTADLVRQVLDRGHRVDRLPAERLKHCAAHQPEVGAAGGRDAAQHTARAEPEK